MTGRSCETVPRGEAGAKGLLNCREGEHTNIYRKAAERMIAHDLVRKARDIERMPRDLTS